MKQTLARLVTATVLGLCVQAMPWATASANEAAPAPQTDARALALSDADRAVIAAHPELRVLCDPARPPVSFIDEGGRCAGLVPDLVEEAANRIGLKIIPLRSDTFDAAIQRFTEGGADAIAPMVRTPERDRLYAITAPLMHFRSLVVARREQRPVADISELQHLRFAMVRGTQEGRALRDRFPKLQVKDYDNIAAALEAIATGQADATLGNPAVTTWYQRRLNLDMLHFVAPTWETERVHHLILRKDLAPVAALLDRAIESLGEQGRDEIRRRWIDAGLDAVGPGAPQRGSGAGNVLRLTAAEKAWIKANPVLRLGIDANYAPFEYIDENGLYSGMVADYVALLEARTGLRFEPQRGLSWEETYARGLKGDIDLFADIIKTPERESYLRFLGPFAVIPSVVVTRDDFPGKATLERLRGESIALVAGYADIEFVRKRYPEIRIVTVPSVADGLRAVSLGEVPATLASVAALNYETKRLGLVNLRIGAQNTAYDTQLFMAVQPSATVLAGILQKALGSISSQERTEIAVRWYAGTQNIESDWEQPVRSIARALGALLLAALAFVLIWNLPRLVGPYR